MHSLINDRVKHALALRGWSQRLLAEHMHLTPSALSQRFAGRVKWTISDLYDLAEIFEVSPCYFFGNPDGRIS